MFGVGATATKQKDAILWSYSANLISQLTDECWSIFWFHFRIDKQKMTIAGFYPEKAQPTLFCPPLEFDSQNYRCELFRFLVQLLEAGALQVRKPLRADPEEAG